MGESGVCIRQAGEPVACGSLSTYTNHGCRGEACRFAHRIDDAVRREDRHAAMVAGTVDPPHGRASTYSNYGCRCDRCRAAESERQRALYVRRKAAKA